MRRRPPRVPQLQDGLQHLLPAGQALIASCAALRCPSKACPAGRRDPMAVRLDHHVARRQRLKLAARAQTLDRRQQPAGRLGGLHRRLGEVEDNDAVDDCEPADGGEPADCESADVGNCLASMTCVDVNSHPDCGFLYCRLAIPILSMLFSLRSNCMDRFSY